MSPVNVTYFVAFFRGVGEARPGSLVNVSRNVPEKRT